MLLVAAGAMLFAAGPRCGRSEKAHSPILGKTARPPVLLILLDALRADACSSFGNARPTTPHLDALAPEGAVLTRAYSQAAYTVTSVSTLMTGLYPPHHGVQGIFDRLGKEKTTLAELFHRAGYATAAFTANPVVSGRYGLRQGFDSLTEIYDLPEVRERYAPKTDEVFYHVQAGVFFDLVTAYLDSLDAARPNEEETPFFLYLHYLQPHTPYAPPEPYANRFDPGYKGTIDGSVATVRAINRGDIHPDARDLAHLRALYEENLAYVDGEVGRLFDELKRRGLYDDLLIIVVSDHGEAFGEHRFCGHNYTVYEEMVRVPWYWKYPAGATAAGLKRDALVELADLMPTLADLLGLPGGADTDGVSLAPLLRGEVKKVKDYAFFRTITDPPTWGITDGRYKLIVPGNKEESSLFDLRSDPGERENLIAPGEAPVFAERARMLGKELGARLEAGGAPRRRADVDKETRARLKALGYIND